MTSLQAIYNNSLVPRPYPVHMRRRSLVYVTSPNSWASFRNMKQLIKIPELHLLQKREHGNKNIYCIAENFRGRKLSRISRLCESFHHKIWGHSIIWHGKSKQYAKVFSTKIIFFAKDPLYGTSIILPKVML